MIGGPEVIDDIELVLGIVHGVTRAVVSDSSTIPLWTRHRNREDVKEGGREAARRVLADFAHLDGLIPFNDETMLGTLEAIDEAKRGGEMKLVSRNGSPQAVAAIRAGRSHGTWISTLPRLAPPSANWSHACWLKESSLKGCWLCPPRTSRSRARTPIPTVRGRSVCRPRASPGRARVVNLFKGVSPSSFHFIKCSGIFAPQHLPPFVLRYPWKQRARKSWLFGQVDAVKGESRAP